MGVDGPKPWQERQVCCIRRPLDLDSTIPVPLQNGHKVSYTYVGVWHTDHAIMVIALQTMGALLCKIVLLDHTSPLLHSKSVSPMYE